MGYRGTKSEFKSLRVRTSSERIILLRIRRAHPSGDLYFVKAQRVDGSWWIVKFKLTA